MTRKTFRQLDGETMKAWMGQYRKIAAKIGTIPMPIWISNDLVMEIGARIEFFEEVNGTRHSGIVRKLYPVCFIDRQ